MICPEIPAELFGLLCTIIAIALLVPAAPRSNSNPPPPGDRPKPSANPPKPPGAE